MYRFGGLIDTGRAALVTTEKQGRPVVVSISAEKYWWLLAVENSLKVDREGKAT